MNKDTETTALVSGMCFLLAVVVVCIVPLLPGCVQHEVTAPQLDALAAHVKRLTHTKPAPALQPVPQNVELSIKGDEVVANDGGAQLLRGYVACRSYFQVAQ